jgi:ER protein Pkr1
MATFFQNLWSSIFTPGPTPTLLIMTNVTFAALQVLLSILLIATHSVHFIVLSFLSGALWWSINWFAREIQIEQAREEERQKARFIGKGKQKGDTRKVSGVIDNTESETETEGLTRDPQFMGIAVDSVAKPTGSDIVVSQQSIEDEGLKTRRSFVGESAGYTSTDSEWEKVDNSKNR